MSPWVLFVIKTMSKFLVGEWGWRRQNLAKKCMVTMWSWKRSKTSWIGHGAWMGIAWGTWKMGASGWNIVPNMLQVLGAQAAWALKHVTWYVSMGGRFQGSSFEAHVLWFAIFNRLKWMLGCHRNMTCFRVGCSKAYVARTWKPMLSRLEMSDAFKTCCWNNIRGL